MSLARDVVVRSLPVSFLKLKIASASRPRLGETASGDITFTREVGARTLFGLVDAHGAGTIAEGVALRAASFLAHADVDDHLGRLFDEMHVSLHGTRGAAATLCLFEAGKLWCSSVGNLELLCVGSRLDAYSSPAIISGRRQRVRVHAGLLNQGTRIVLYSSAIPRHVAAAPDRALSANDACNSIISAAGTYEAATVLIADVVEAS
jgi:hypothetical protein